jgi:hypothetical protein
VRKNTEVEPGYDIGVEEKVKKKKDTDSEIHLLVLGPVFKRQKRVQLILPVNGIVSGDLYDCSGRKVSTVLSEKHFTKGQHVISLDNYLKGCASGSYFIWLVVEQEDGKRKVFGKKLHYLR